MCKLLLLVLIFALAYACMRWRLDLLSQMRDSILQLFALRRARRDFRLIIGRVHIACAATTAAAAAALFNMGHYLVVLQRERHSEQGDAVQPADAPHRRCACAYCACWPLAHSGVILCTIPVQYSRAMYVFVVGVLFVHVLAQLACDVLLSMCVDASQCASTLIWQANDKRARV